MARSYKNIKISRLSESRLRRQAVERGVSYQRHCEDILAYKAEHKNISFKYFTEGLEDSFAGGGVPDIELETQKRNTGNSRKKYFDCTDIVIKPDMISGIFSRSESNIYTNGKIWQYRRMEIGKGLVQTYYQTKELAIKAKENN